MLRIKNTLKVMALCLCLTMLCGIIPVGAAAADSTALTPVEDTIFVSEDNGITPRGGVEYTNQPTNGARSGSFTLSTSFTTKKYTVQTQGFNSNCIITIAVYKNGRQVSESGAMLSGNDKKENLSLITPWGSGTYEIRWTVTGTGGGWIGVWLY